MALCCWRHLVTLPWTWRGRTTVCPCGTRLSLREGDWVRA
jgi:hypothetical protein